MSKKTKKSDKGTGVSLFSPEFQEAVGRMKDKEPELEALAESEKTGATDQALENVVASDQPIQYDSPSPTDLEAMITSIVKRELQSLLKGVEVAPVPKKGRGGDRVSSVEKKTFSIPKDLWEEVHALGGIASNHVAAALRLYLNLRKQEPAK